MAAPTLAWGECHLFGLPDGRHVYGREFALLPAGTMFAASVILHGIIGAPATVDDDNVARVAADAPLIMLPTRTTDGDELSIYRDDVAEGFRIRQMQDVQG